VRGFNCGIYQCKTRQQEAEKVSIASHIFKRVSPKFYSAKNLHTWFPLCNRNCYCNWGTCTVPPTRRPRAHLRVNPYPGARRQNETEIFSDHDKTSPRFAYKKFKHLNETFQNSRNFLQNSVVAQQCLKTQTNSSYLLYICENTIHCERFITSCKETVWLAT